LGDRVRHWITLNEPWVSSMLGYVAGVHAPGRRDPALAFPTTHHLLLGHGLAVRAVRETSPEAQVAVTLNLSDITAASDDPADVEAARRVDGTQNRLYLDPVLRGAYPADVLDDLAEIGPLDALRDGDLDVVATPVDLLGVNYYFGFEVARAGAAGTPVGPAYPTAPEVTFVDRGKPRTAMGWEVEAAGLTSLLRRLHREYPGVPVVITENGSAWHDEVSPDGEVHDPRRVAYLREHLAACRDALADGVPLRGYFAWSLLDNFEWAEGYAKRFGLVRVDYDTQRRTVKDSGRVYAEIVRSNGAEI
ncbi:MAG: glycoside hydrolase family 1 protein, partial [Actinomycetes bacterium]